MHFCISPNGPDRNTLPYLNKEGVIEQNVGGTLLSGAALSLNGPVDDHYIKNMLADEELCGIIFILRVDSPSFNLFSFREMAIEFPKLLLRKNSSFSFTFKAMKIIHSGDEDTYVQVSGEIALA